jgi:hypothetical protein
MRTPSSVCRVPKLPLKTASWTIPAHRKKRNRPEEYSSYTRPKRQDADTNRTSALHRRREPSARASGNLPLLNDRAKVFG